MLALGAQRSNRRRGREDNTAAKTDERKSSVDEDASSTTPPLRPARDRRFEDVANDNKDDPATAGVASSLVPGARQRNNQLAHHPFSILFHALMRAFVREEEQGVAMGHEEEQKKKHEENQEEAGLHGGLG